MVPYLRSLPTPHQPEPPDYAEIYQRLLLECSRAADSMSDKALRKRLSYLGVKGGPIIYRDDVVRNYSKPLSSFELLDVIWRLVEVTRAAISGLTPNEFMTVFPIEKWYDGERSGAKDYFSTMEELQKIGMDTVIGEHVDSLLFDYQNPHVRKFTVFKSNVVDIYRAYQGKPSMIMELMAGKGAPPAASAPKPLWQTIISGNLPMTVSDKYVVRWPRSSLCI